jgi:tRNA threonylcarbamoyladenosine biosynthesis protein TsaB
MLILTIRTDNPKAELGLFEDDKKISYETWHAHRQLAETIHNKITELLQGRTLSQLDGVVCFEGPGSFTGLRIGLTVGNALAYAREIPIVATNGEDWQKFGIAKLLDGENQKIVVPDYGAPVHITQQKK